MIQGVEMKYVNKLFISLLFSMLTIFSLQANEVHKVVIQPGLCNRNLIKL